MRLSGNHNDELTELLNKRTALVAKLPANVLLQYDRIREFHTNAAVSVRRNSCSGCFNAIPPQKLVEIRAYKQMFTCESCGRILYPEDMEVPAV
jgi:predicted  nucleic acid-binding Zn-ribbon protein